MHSVKGQFSEVQKFSLEGGEDRFCSVLIFHVFMEVSSSGRGIRRKGKLFLENGIRQLLPHPFWTRRLFERRDNEEEQIRVSEFRNVARTSRHSTGNFF